MDTKNHRRFLNLQGLSSVGLEHPSDTRKVMDSNSIVPMGISSAGSSSGLINRRTPVRSRNALYNLIAEPETRHLGLCNVTKQAFLC